VAVLGLISLFTHMHIFWIIGLLLALIDLPDLMSPLRRIADSVEKLAGTNTPSASEAPQERKLQPKAYADNFRFDRLSNWTH